MILVDERKARKASAFLAQTSFSRSVCRFEKALVTTPIKGLTASDFLKEIKGSNKQKRI